jgi:hypothetical protein
MQSHAARRRHAQDCAFLLSRCHCGSGAEPGRARLLRTQTEHEACKERRPSGGSAPSDSPALSRSPYKPAAPLGSSPSAAAVRFALVRLDGRWWAPCADYSLLGVLIASLTDACAVCEPRQNPAVRGCEERRQNPPSAHPRATPGRLRACGFASLRKNKYRTCSHAGLPAGCFGCAVAQQNPPCAAAKSADRTRRHTPVRKQPAHDGGASRQRKRSRPGREWSGTRMQRTHPEPGPQTNITHLHPRPAAPPFPAHITRAMESIARARRAAVRRFTGPPKEARPDVRRESKSDSRIRARPEEARGGRNPPGPHECRACAAPGHQRPMPGYARRTGGGDESEAASLDWWKVGRVRSRATKPGRSDRAAARDRAVPEASHKSRSQSGHRWSRHQSSKPQLTNGWSQSTVRVTRKVVTSEQGIWTRF